MLTGPHTGSNRWYTMLPKHYIELKHALHWVRNQTVYNVTGILHGVEIGGDFRGLKFAVHIASEALYVIISFLEYTNRKKLQELLC